MAIRNSFESQIHQALNQEGFVSTDFSLESKVKFKSVVVALKYLLGEASFVATIPTQGKTKDGYLQYDIVLDVSPGNMVRAETLQTMGESGVIEHIGAWLRRLAEDLAATPHARRQAATESQFQALCEQLGIAPDDETQIDELQSRSLIEWVKNIETRLAENIRQQELTKAEVSGRLHSLQQQIEVLTALIETRPPKRSVIKAILGRILHWTSDDSNRRLLQDAGKTVVGMLSDGNQNLLPPGKS